MSHNPQHHQQQQQQQAPPSPAAAHAAIQAAAAMAHASSNAVVRICGSSPSECGYCKGARAARPEEAHSSSKAYSLLADFMKPSVYEGFLLRGWRRSGTYLYKPDNFHSCCPALTIRLPVADFVPTKSQRKVSKKMDKLLRPAQAPTTQPQQQQLPSKKKPKTQPNQTTQKHSAQRTSFGSFTPAEQLVMQAGIADQIQEWTLAIIKPWLAANANISLSTFFPNPPSFKVKQLQGKTPSLMLDAYQESQTDSARVTLWTPVCAALAGKSRGAVDRDALSEHLMQQLQHGHVGKPQPVPQSHSSTLVNNHAISSTTTWNLANVHRHDKSGQVFCDLLVVLPTQSQPLPVQDMADTTTPPPPSTDKLHQWFSQHMWNKTIASVATGKNPAAIGPPIRTISAPYTCEVTTLPAHDSALDPDVHKLYFLYQHHVHDDPDPYTTLLPAWKQSETNSSNNPSPAPQPPPPLQPLDDNDNEEDWGYSAMELSSDARSYCKNPPGWIEAAKQMLHREYQGLPSAQQKQITKAFCSFFQFLVESPFPALTQKTEQTTMTNMIDGMTYDNHHSSTSALAVTSGQRHHKTLPCGTYHQQYRIGGMLIAVGVVDILPSGLSSVYLFYHPQFAHDLCPMGKYAILQEIDFCHHNLRLPYYYLGYYIESCPKMRYKAEYRPSELLCPTSYRWVVAHRAQRILQHLSPVQHCCTLYYEYDILMDHALRSRGGGNVDNNSDREAGMDLDLAFPHPAQHKSGTPPTSILKKPNTNPPRNNLFVEQVCMDVGVGVPVMLSMLHERGRETVRPLLDEFVDQTGPELSQQCLVKFS